MEGAIFPDHNYKLFFFYNFYVFFSIYSINDLLFIMKSYNTESLWKENFVVVEMSSLDGQWNRKRWLIPLMKLSYNPAA